MCPNTSPEMKSHPHSVTLSNYLPLDRVALAKERVSDIRKDKSWPMIHEIILVRFIRGLKPVFWIARYFLNFTEFSEQCGEVFSVLRFSKISDDFFVFFYTFLLILLIFLEFCRRINKIEKFTTI